MDLSWQEWLTAALATACAVWVVWITLRPFVRKVASACGMCAGCGPSSSAGNNGRPPASKDLLQIDPPDSRGNT